MKAKTHYIDINKNKEIIYSMFLKIITKQMNSL